MVEQLHQFLKHSLGYDDAVEYAYFETADNKSKLAPIAFTAFVLFAIVYVFTLIFGWFTIHFAVVIGVFVVLVILLLVLKKGNKFQAIVVTTKYLIERKGKDEFVAIAFDDISSYDITKDGIHIGAKGKEVLLGLNMFREELDSIVDILEAKGKTFEPEKEFMIRPIEIRIENNIIHLDEVEHRTALDDLFDRFSDQYMMLTPGFVDLIIFRNANVLESKVLNDSNSLVMKLDRFEVKEGHPENTKFDSIIAQDCIVVFQQVSISHMILQNLHDDSEKDKVCDNTLDCATQYLDNAVISDWKINKNKVDFVLATGVHTLKMSFSFKDVIVGWNKTKE